MTEKKEEVVVGHLPIRKQGREYDIRPMNIKYTPRLLRSGKVDLDSARMSLAMRKNEL